MNRSTSSQLAFGCFLLVNATLFLRPAELLPALGGLPIYEGLIGSSFLLSTSSLRSRFRMDRLRQQPVTLCVIGMLGAVVLSHLSHFYLGGVKAGGIMFVKVLVYYGLLIALVDSPKRLRALLLTVAICASAMVAVCVADYAGVIKLPTIEHISDRDGKDMTGDDIRVLRMRGMGIFQDPNDIAMLIMAAGVLCACFLMERRAGGKRFLWIGPLVILTLGLFFTRSRGGLLCAGAAGCVLTWFRYGPRHAVALMLAGLCGVQFIGGRQGSIDLDSGTGHARIELWNEGLMALRSSDVLFGIGEGFYTEKMRLVAHNSFVHAYVELGLLGGTVFFGTFFFAGWGLYRLGKVRSRLRHPELARLQPFLSAIVAGWCVGMLSLSRCYVVPTYLVLGIVAAYLSLCSLSLEPRRPVLCFNRRTCFRMVGGSAACFVGISLFVAILVR